MILSYVVAILSVATAVILIQLSHIQNISPTSLLICAVLLSSWYGGTKPGLLSWILSIFAFDYYFVTPAYSLGVLPPEILRLAIFAAASGFVLLLSVVQRRTADSLLRAREVVDGTVRKLKQTNEELQEEIAERKRAEALLYVKEQEFRAIVENAPDQIIRYDREFRRTYVNPAVANTYDLSAEVLIGQPIGSVIHDAGLDVKEEELAQFRQRIAAVFETGKCSEFEMAWPTPAGTRYYSSRLFPELDKDGSVINVLGIGRDITESMQAAAVLKEQKEILQKIVDHIPVMINFTDGNGRTTLVNRDWERTLGWSMDEIRNKDLDVFAECYPDPLYRQSVMEFLNAASGEWKDFRTRIRDGRIIDTSWIRLRLSDGTTLGIGQDVTERRSADRSVRLFRALLDQSNDAIEVIDPDTLRFLDCNKSAYQDLGYSREEFLSLSVFDINPLINEETAARLAQEMERSGFAIFEGIHRRKDGSTFPVEVNLKSIRLERNYRLAVVRDITERKKAEEISRKSEDRLRLLTDTIPTMAWSLTADGTIDFVNRRWVDYTGLTLEEEIEEPTRVIHPEDIPRVLENWQVAMVTGEASEAELRLRRADGEYRWFLVRTAPLRDEKGSIIKWFGISIDIEDRRRVEEKLKQSENQLSEAQRLAHIGSWDWDVATNTVTWSEELYHIFGLQSGSISLAKDVDRFIHPDDLESGWDIVKRAVASCEPYDYYHRIIRPDGTERMARSRGSIVSDERGEPIRVFGATQDVTELKRAEEHLKATTEQLRALSVGLQSAREEEGTRISREIHDELGATLSSLRWDLEELDECISESGDESKQREIRKKIEAMMRLTDTTVETVRRIASELRPIALDTLGLSEAIELHANQFQSRTGIAIECDCSLENVNLSGDESTAIFRIFQEALTNVLRHAQATNVDITMRADAGEFILTITDNGRGITEDEKAGARTLGILGMRERANLIGGEIEFTVAGGTRGTVVSVRMPISR
jgi:PAS domain S-box-containing protein